MRLLSSALHLGLWCSLLVASSPFWPSGQALAAERVVLKYQMFRRSVSVQELTTLAETGEVSRGMRAYLMLARRDPRDLQRALNRDVGMNVILLDRVLNSPLGDTALDQVSQAIYTPSRQADRQAMRSALILSAQDDNRISMIEVLQNYPTEEVHVDGDRLLDAYRQLRTLQRQVNNLLGGDLF